MRARDRLHLIGDQLGATRTVIKERDRIPFALPSARHTGWSWTRSTTGQRGEATWRLDAASRRRLATALTPEVVERLYRISLDGPGSSTR
jgi:hypothetical protein